MVKMPRSVKRAIAVGQDAKMVDQRAETGERRGALVNRIADLHCVVVYRLRAQPPHVGQRACLPPNVEDLEVLVDTHGDLSAVAIEQRRMSAARLIRKRAPCRWIMAVPERPAFP